MQKDKQDELNKLVKSCAIMLKAVMPEGIGWTVTVFDFGEPGPRQGYLSYMSNAQREDNIAVLQELIEKLKELPDEK